MFSSFAEQSATDAELIRTGADPADMPEVEYAFYKGSIFTVHGPMDGRRGGRERTLSATVQRRARGWGSAKGMSDRGRLMR